MYRTLTPARKRNPIPFSAGSAMFPYHHARLQQHPHLNPYDNLLLHKSRIKLPEQDFLHILSDKSVSTFVKYYSVSFWCTYHPSCFLASFAYKNQNTCHPSFQCFYNNFNSNKRKSQANVLFLLFTIKKGSNTLLVRILPPFHTSNTAYSLIEALLHSPQSIFILYS